VMRVRAPNTSFDHEHATAKSSDPLGWWRTCTFSVGGRSRLRSND